MARYIDADALLKRLPDALPYKASVKRVLMQAPSEDIAKEFTCAFGGEHKVAECPMFDEIVRTKADTVREMQERLGKHFCHDPAFLGVEQRMIMDVIDRIANEMLEGTQDA